MCVLVVCASLFVVLGVCVGRVGERAAKVSFLIVRRNLLEYPLCLSE